MEYNPVSNSNNHQVNGSCYNEYESVEFDAGNEKLNHGDGDQDEDGGSNYQFALHSHVNSSKEEWSESGCVQNFGDIYEKIEGRKRRRMMELEKMRKDFERELELQKKQNLQRVQAKLTKIRLRDD
ncbi:hypothetical protein L6452_21560 [Arctium lappa]|uniref:Uncharacterized protein n=1 Tax=Arctium lappa TaxID=4217 RepID=A0ACB9AZ13_ARCLA|nr:hypothetical protein L6452_21560 [Arctium lappa]